MTILAEIFAGLGLFFIGVKLIGNNLKQMSGRRFRRLVARTTESPVAAGGLGVLAGAVTQSTSAVTFIMISLITAGLTEVRKAMPLVAWANVGTSVLVMLAVIDIRIGVLLLLGLTGACYYFDLNRSARWGALVGALLGIGMLFLGLGMIKAGAGPLRDEALVREILAFTDSAIVLAFVAGLLLTLVAQSSATVSVVAVAMTVAGILTRDQTIMIVLGASIGSGASILLMGSNLRGTPRQLALYQAAIKVLGVALLLPPVLLERYGGPAMVNATLTTLAGDLATQVAWVYLILQVVGVLAATALAGPLAGLLARLSPATATEQLSRPLYIYPQAAEEPESALDLVEKEQVRLIRQLPAYMDFLRTEADVTLLASDAPTLRRAHADVVKAVDAFTADLLQAGAGRRCTDRLLHVKWRTALIAALQDGLLEMVDSLASADQNPKEVQRLTYSLAEATHLTVTALGDALETRDALDLEILRSMTTDRADMMERIRGTLLTTGARLDFKTREAMVRATTVFERVIWLVRRFTLTLGGVDDEDVDPDATVRMDMTGVRTLSGAGGAAG